MKLRWDSSHQKNKQRVRPTAWLGELADWLIATLLLFFFYFSFLMFALHSVELNEKNKNKCTKLWLLFNKTRSKVKFKCVQAHEWGARADQRTNDCARCVYRWSLFVQSERQWKRVIESERQKERERERPRFVRMKNHMAAHAFEKCDSIWPVVELMGTDHLFLFFLYRKSKHTNDDYVRCMIDFRWHTVAQHKMSNHSNSSNFSLSLVNRSN